MAKVLLWSYLGLVAFSLLGLLLSKFTGLDPGGIDAAASLGVLTAGALCVGLMINNWGVCLGVMAAAGIIEAVGVATGLPFGSYRYTDAWFPTVILPGGHLFPLALPLAWLLVAGSSWMVVGRWLQGLPRVLASGLLAMVVDIPLEDVMTKGLGYWEWKEAGPVFGAPLMNSGGWLATGILCAWILSRSKAEEKPAQHPGLVFGAYCLLMGQLALLQGLQSFPLWILLALGFSTAGLIPSRTRLQEQTA